MSGTLVIIPPMGAVRTLRYEGRQWSLEQVQSLCEGYIERVQVRWDGRIRDAYVDEDGVAHQAPYNERATLALSERWQGQQIVGTAVVIVPDSKAKKDTA